MNKVKFISIAAIVALATTLSFAQEGGTKFGIRAGFNLNNPTEKGGNEFDWGAGGGIATSIPITDFLSFNPELSFYYKKLSNINIKGWGSNYVNEFAISIPVMFQITHIVNVPFYFTTGAQLDIPFSTEMHTELYGYGGGQKISEEIDDRASIDFGIAFGLGYKITPNFAIDLRAVIGLTNIADYYFDDESYSYSYSSEGHLNQYGLGLTYFF